MDDRMSPSAQTAQPCEQSIVALQRIPAKILAVAAVVASMFVAVGPSALPANADHVSARSAIDVRIAVTDQFLDAVAEQARVAAAIEHRDLVTAREGVFDLVWPNKASSTENKDGQLLFRAGGRDRNADGAGAE